LGLLVWRLVFCGWVGIWFFGVLLGGSVLILGLYGLMVGSVRGLGVVGFFILFFLWVPLGGGGGGGGGGLGRGVVCGVCF